MLTLTLLLVLSAFVVVIASTMGRAPLWVAVLLLAIAQLLPLVPR